MMVVITVIMIMATIAASRYENNRRLQDPTRTIPGDRLTPNSIFATSGQAGQKVSE